MALAPALRRRPALDKLDLGGNPFGDEGLAALVAPPPQGRGRRTVLAQLSMLNLGGSQITDAGCAQLASRLTSGALPALVDLCLSDYFGGISASVAARDAVHKAKACRLHGAPLRHGFGRTASDARRPVQ